MRLPSILSAAMLCTATLLAFAMALVSAINDRPELWRGPPDEYGHRSAARYYIDHWLPPKVGDAETLDTYSRDYGLSYLNDTDPVYEIAGKFAALVSPVVADHDVALRLFNVMLLGILAGLCIVRPAAWLVFVPLLITPQVWYIFSYFNGDAFPLFLAILIACQVSQPASLFNRYLDSPGVLRSLSGACLLGVLIGLLVLSKRNYLTFAALAPTLIVLARLGAPGAFLLAASAFAGAAWYLDWIALGAIELRVLAAGTVLALLGSIFFPAPERRARGQMAAKLAAVGLIAFTVAAPRHAWDAMANGSPEERRAALGVLQEEIAKPPYKPSQIQAEKTEGAYYGIGLRKRGTPLSELFTRKWGWHTLTFVSATGQYGWVEFSAEKPYYVMIAAGYLALFATYAWAVLRARSVAAGLHFLFVSAFAAATVAVSIHHSWVNDFQAQGRYLFPIAAMLGVGLHAARNTLDPRAITGVVAYCFVLSVWSFIFIGLWHVPRSF